MARARGVLVMAMLCAASALAQTSASERALALEQQGQWKDAETAWRQVLAANPRDAEACGHLGLVLAREQDYPAAVDAYRKALALDPKMQGLQLDLGLALFKQGKLKEAIAPLKAALAAAPGNPQPRILLGMSYYGAGEFARAVPELQFAVEQAPANLEMRNVLAQACLHARQFACTLEQFKAIVAVNPNAAQADMLAGEADDGLNKPDDAIAEFEAAEKASPQEPNVHFGLGYLLWKQHKYAEAAREFALELMNDPEHAQAMAYLGDTQMKLEQTAQAQATLEKAVELPGATRMAWVDLGIVLADAGKNDQAAEDFRRAIAMDPQQVDAHWRLARLLQAEGKTEEARAEFARAAALHQQQDEGLVKQLTPGK
jgi:tetratricopeptide (TPR) repeat protein